MALSGVAGLVGCVREVEVNGEPLEPCSVVRSGHKMGQVSLDNWIPASDLMHASMVASAL